MYTSTTPALGGLRQEDTKSWLASHPSESATPGSVRETWPQKVSKFQDIQGVHTRTHTNTYAQEMESDWGRHPWLAFNLLMHAYTCTHKHVHTRTNNTHTYASHVPAVGDSGLGEPPSHHHHHHTITRPPSSPTPAPQHSHLFLKGKEKDRVSGKSDSSETDISRTPSSPAWAREKGAKAASQNPGSHTHAQPCSDHLAH